MYELKDIISTEIGSINHEWIIDWYWIWWLDWVLNILSMSWV